MRGRRKDAQMCKWGTLSLSRYGHYCMEQEKGSHWKFERKPKSCLVILIFPQSNRIDKWECNNCILNLIILVGYVMTAPGFYGILRED